MLQEALRTSNFPKEIIATRSWLLNHSDFIKTLPEGISLHQVTPEVLKASLTTVNPDGVASLFPIDALPNTSTDSKFVLALDRLQDPGNLGTIFRTALAAEIDEIWLASGADPLAPKVLRSSAGAVLHLPFCRFGPDIEEALEELVINLKKSIRNGWQVVASLAPGSSFEKPIFPYWDLDWRKPTVLVMGNEASGLHPLLKASCTHGVTLPHSPKVESLNVASAAVPLLLERLRFNMTTDQP